ncbi:hypothetical protein [Foetidibacter luteolus]|nr:hypothetical protein [Foetidibacter luteolus]
METEVKHELYETYDVHVAERTMTVRRLLKKRSQFFDILENGYD